MKFVHPWWLLAAPAACLLLSWIWHLHDVRQRAALARFVSAHLTQQLSRSVSVVRRRLRRGLVLLAVVALAAALAGPLLGFRWEPINRRGVEILFALDTSRSMLTADVKPDRLTRAKLAIDDFANQLDGDAVGIVAFAGKSFLSCPVTLDREAFHETLSAIDTRTIARGGTNIEAAIAGARHALSRHPNVDRTLILVTDGEELEGAAVEAARAAAQQDRIRIFTVGVGTAAGDLIELPAADGGGYVKDDAGKLVRSRLDEDKLKAIATAAGGFYVPLGAEGEGLQRILKTVIDTVDKRELSYRQRRIYIERYQWPLGASLALLMTSLMINPGRRRIPARRMSTAAAALAGLAALAGGADQPIHAADAPAEPIDAAKPAQEFRSGTSAYRAGRFSQAAQSFERSIKRAPSSDARRLRDQQDAYYNLGNTLYRTGQKSERSAPQETIKLWTDAIRAYDTALQLRSDDVDSRFNRDLVQRKLDELQQRQNPPPSGGGAPPPSTPPPSSGQSPPSGAPPESTSAPGQMSAEEAGELLDSAKGEERPSPAAMGSSVRASDQPPDKPFKNW